MRIPLKTFENGLDFILMDTVNTLELAASFDESESSPVSSGFLCLVSIGSYNSIMQLASSIKSCKIWCQARALHLGYTRGG